MCTVTCQVVRLPLLLILLLTLKKEVFAIAKELFVNLITMVLWETDSEPIHNAQSYIIIIFAYTLKNFKNWNN